MKLTIFNTDGTDSGKKAELDDQIFAIEPHEVALYEEIRRHLAAKRQGTAKTKERSEVRGGGRKAYRQKGTGMARRGSIRSPLLKGGGTVFGPKPRDYSYKVPKQVRQLARKSALSLKASEEAIKVVSTFSIDEPKTKEVVKLLAALELTGKKVLILTAETNKNLHKSARNIPGVHVLEAAKTPAYDVINAENLVLLEDSISALESSINTKTEDKVA